VSILKTLTFLLPCLNEAETLLICINKAQKSLKSLQIDGDVLIADNGSTDGSQGIARRAGAKVIDVPVRGYGAALKAGIESSDSEYIVMGDADDSYALDDVALFLIDLENGSDLVMGNRFKGGISPGAMPWLHKYLGNPILSWFGKVLFKVPIGDFHCGLRAFRTDSIRGLNLKSTGMEFASEMVVKASLNGLKITEVPTTLKPDGRSRAPHLRTWRDGWRHLIFLLTASPRYLFLYPGVLLAAVGLIGLLVTLSGQANVYNFFLSSNTYFLSIGLILIGIQTVIMAILARVYSYSIGTLPKSKHITGLQRHFTLERGIVLGLALAALGFSGFIFLLSNWNGSGFDSFSTLISLRISGAIILVTLTGIQILFASFFASMIQSN
jgi:glycosyltransferase involved in cell wall biosynthesis